MIPKLYTNPKTNESLTATEWARKLNLTLSGFRNRLRRGGNVFEHQPTNEERLIENPITGEKATIAQWGRRLEISSEGFSCRIEKWGVNDPRTFKTCLKPGSMKPLTKRELEEYHCQDMRHTLAVLNGVKFCTNPSTGESRLATEWAEYYGVSLSEFYQAAKKHGRNSMELYKCFERSVEGLG